jgi:predicted nucleotide-binding protein
MDLTYLRELIRIGEFLEKNSNNESTFNQWLFDVEDFVLSLEPRRQQQISGAIFKLKNNNSSMRMDVFRTYHQNFTLIMGFLRSTYNRCCDVNKIAPTDVQSVFIIHGHDNSLITDVKRCVSEIGLSPIVLREQPDAGKTIVEKLEVWLGNCMYAIVLYTPCDTGKASKDNNLEDRARQNVVYEHGLFQGYLGRKRIIVLRKGNTVMPGDCSGVVYTSVNNEGWQEKLKNEITNIDKP